MSETEQRETEIVAGTIGGITQKKADTWTVAVTAEGSQYAKNLWTKDTELVESLSAKIGQAGAFVCGASYWTRQDGQQVRSLWIQGESDGTEQPTPKPNGSVATPAAAPQGRTYTPDLKDRMIVRQSALKAAAEIVAPRAAASVHPDFDAALETMKAAQRFETWVYRDIDPVPSEAGGPALSEHDQAIPF